MGETKQALAKATELIDSQRDKLRKLDETHKETETSQKELLESLETSHQVAERLRLEIGRLEADMTAKSAMNDRLGEEVKKYQVMFDNAYKIVETKSKAEFEKYEELRTQLEDVVHQLEHSEAHLEKKTRDLEDCEKKLEESANTINEMNSLLEAAASTLDENEASHNDLSLKFSQLEEANNRELLFSLYFRSYHCQFLSSHTSNPFPFTSGLKLSLENGSQESSSLSSTYTPLPFLILLLVLCYRLNSSLSV